MKFKRALYSFKRRNQVSGYCISTSGLVLYISQFACRSTQPMALGENMFFLVQLPRLIEVYILFRS